MPEVAVSIILCTRNRAADLRETLRSLAGVAVPPALPTELIVVDNGSTDDTAQAAQEARLPRITMRVIAEPRVGKCVAYNTGLDAARGRVLLFTDDDVRLPETWVTDMTGPLLRGQCDALAGGVTLAPHLLRPWMTARHRVLLASTETLDPHCPLTMVGANMAFRAAVRARVPFFDTELGPGALGADEETLFSGQLRAAGFRLDGALAVTVTHHFDPARLLPTSLGAMAHRQGLSQGYVLRHWEHARLRALPLRQLVNRARLLRARLRSQPADGISAQELNALYNLGIVMQYARERRRPPCYERHGLAKRAQV